VEECGPCPVFARFNLAFALKVKKKHERILNQGEKNLSQSRKTSLRLRKTSVRVEKLQSE
jgi:hypothetical protein